MRDKVAECIRGISARVWRLKGKKQVVPALGSDSRAKSLLAACTQAQKTNLTGFIPYVFIHADLMAPSSHLLPSSHLMPSSLTSHPSTPSILATVYASSRV